MAFPPYWLQTCTKLPAEIRPGHLTPPQGFYNQWWDWDGAIPPTFDYDIFATDCQFRCWQLCNGLLPASFWQVQVVETKVYIQDNNGFHAPTPATGFLVWDTTLGVPGPAELQVMFRLSAEFPQVLHARKYLGPVLVSDIKGKLYVPFNVGAADGFCLNILAPFISQGISFWPGMASYKLSAFSRYSSCSWRDNLVDPVARIRILKRRGRQPDPAGPAVGPMPVP